MKPLRAHVFSSARIPRTSLAHACFQREHIYSTYPLRRTSPSTYLASPSTSLARVFWRKLAPHPCHAGLLFRIAPDGGCHAGRGAGEPGIAGFGPRIRVRPHQRGRYVCVEDEQRYCASAARRVGASAV